METSFPHLDKPAPAAKPRCGWTAPREGAVPIFAVVFCVLFWLAVAAGLVWGAL